MSPEQLLALELQQTAAREQFQRFGILELFERAKDRLLETYPNARIEMQIPLNPQVKAILRMQLDDQNDVSCRLYRDPDCPTFSFSNNGRAITKGKAGYVVSAKSADSDYEITS